MSTARLLAQSDSAYGDLDASASLAHAERMLARDSTDHHALWRSARASVSLGMLSEQDPERQVFYYEQAERYARAAVRADPESPRGHEWLAVALGRTALTHGPRTRARYADEIYREATRTLELDPDSDAAHHVLGVWHAEIRRMSGLSRFIARNLLGAETFDNASWERATELLERAVELAPGSVVHRVDLARIYLDRKREADARSQLRAAINLPESEPPDGLQRELARALLEELGTGGD